MEDQMRSKKENKKTRENSRELIVYKVVREICHRYYSAVIRPKMGGLTYEIGETTKPDIPEAPIMAFAEVHRASDFVMWNSGVGMDGYPRILECRAVEFERPLKKCILYPQEIGSAIDMHYFWKKRLWEFSKGMRESFREVPNGTVFCSEVTPIRLV